MQIIYVYDSIISDYRKLKYKELKQALESDIAIQGLNGYRTGSPNIYKNLPEGIFESNPEDESEITFIEGCGYCPIVLNGLCHIGMQFRYEDTNNPQIQWPALTPNGYILRNEINTDPLGRGYAQMSIDQKVNSLNTVKRALKQRLITARALLAEIDPVVAGIIYVKLKTAAENNPVIAMAMDMMTTYSDGGGLDICHPNTQVFIDSLLGVLFTQEEVDAVKGLASITRAQELIGRDATVEDLLI